MWIEDIEFPVFANTASAGQEPDNIEYVIATNQTAAIVRLMGVVDDHGLPVAAYMPEPGTVRLAYAPNGNVNFVARYALTVNDPVGDDSLPYCPDWVINKYQNDIINGVVGRMMSMTAKPFSNERLAVYHTKAFQTAIANARVEQNRQNTYRGQVWKFPQAFNRRRWR
jgi:hypothetical protein